MLAPGPRLLAAVLTVAHALLQGGCNDVVPIGSECRQYSGKCRQADPSESGGSGPTPGEDSGATKPEADGSADAGVDATPDGSRDGPDGSNGSDGEASAGLDAGDDASADAEAPPERPAAADTLFDNGSFELTDGSLGWLSGTGTTATPWNPCTAIFSASFQAIELVDAPNIAVAAPLTAPPPLTPSEGDAFVQFNYGTNVRAFGDLSQTLAAPLEVGRRYAFEIDVAMLVPGDVDPRISLAVIGANNECPGPTDTTTELAQTKSIAEIDAWHTACVEFTATEANTHILLSPEVNDLLFGTVAWTFVDKMREVVSCE